MVETIEFNGRIYRRYPNAKGLSDRRYFRCSRNTPPHRYLHRDVWEFYVGTIPVGHEIHHKFSDDYDTLDPTRLECLTETEHAYHHTRLLVGKPKTLEHRAALSAAKLGKKIGPMAEEHRDAISAGKTGKPLTLSQRAWMDDADRLAARNEKIRQTKLRYWAEKKAQSHG